MSSLKMDVDKAICQMVEMLLPRFSPENLGLRISLSIFIVDWESNKQVRKEVIFLFHRPGNYTKVFMYVRNFDEALPAPMFLSDHDSCWRDGVNSGLNQVNKIIIEEIESWGKKYKGNWKYNRSSCDELSETVAFKPIGNDYVEVDIKKNHDWDHVYKDLFIVTMGKRINVRK